MNEITRIHLAKVPYEIEIPAKKELESYLETLQNYTNDPEIVADIEIRMTEILLERGVKAEGVIAQGDVRAVKEQMGSPEEIAGETSSVAPQPAIRKLYRDMDNSLVGGVVSGLAAYVKIDVLVARIIFIVLTFVTSGFLLLVYVVMWALVPAAKTSVDKLRLRGQPVTIDALTTMSDTDILNLQRRGEVVRKALLYIVGVGAVIGSLASLLLIGVAVISVLAEDIFSQSGMTTLWIVAFGLAIVSGLLLATLFGLVAYACFTRDFSKRLLTTLAIIIVTGLVSFSAAIGVGAYESWQAQQQVQASVKKSQIAVPEGFDSVTAVTFKADPSAEIEYVVDERPHMVLEATSDFVPDVKLDGTVAEVQLLPKKGAIGYTQASLTIYGPALSAMDVEQGRVTYVAKDQDSLTLAIGQGGSGALLGSVKDLSVSVGQDGSFYANGATVETVRSSSKHNSSVEFGNVRNLDIVYQDACPSDGTVSVLNVQRVADRLTVNGQPRAMDSFESSCLELSFDDER